MEKGSENREVRQFHHQAILSLCELESMYFLTLRWCGLHDGVGWKGQHIASYCNPAQHVTALSVGSQLGHHGKVQVCIHIEKVQ